MMLRVSLSRLVGLEAHRSRLASIGWGFQRRYRLSGSVVDTLFDEIRSPEVAVHSSLSAEGRSLILN